MVKPIVKDIEFLGQKSVPASPLDVGIIKDLTDTFSVHHKRCVGMAANMIGHKKRIIIVSMGVVNVVMLNPILKSKSGVYETEESCLSLEGKRKATRYHYIDVEFLDCNFKRQRQQFSGYVAQIILHEMDHLEGIII